MFSCFGSSHILASWLPSDVSHMLHNTLEEAVFQGPTFPCNFISYLYSKSDLAQQASCDYSPVVVFLFSGYVPQ